MTSLNRRTFLRSGLFASGLWLSSIFNKSQAMEPSQTTIKKPQAIARTPAVASQSSISSPRLADQSLTTFSVADVDMADQPLPTVPGHEAIATTLLQSVNPEQQNPGIEASSHYADNIPLVADILFHPFVAALHHAYADHHPLCLSPDMIWLLIAQGLANHINANAENLRHQFVEHEGKVTLTVRRDQFVKGSPDNDWAGVFGEFSTQIRGHIGSTTHDRLLPTFSTTSIVEKAATEIVLMDAMQSYFSYAVSTLCGIPEIKLEGTVSDWQEILRRTKELAQYDLQWWIDTLVPILEQFITAAAGQPDKEFWESIYKWHSVASGNPYITGWITAFFPYLKDPETGKASLSNFWLTGNSPRIQEMLYPTDETDADRCPFGDFGRGLTTDDFPSGLAMAPFRWFYYNTTYEMEFLGGFIGIKQDMQDLTLRPEIGWVVREITDSEDSE